MKIFIALLTARIIRIICRLVKRGGTGLPGRVALKICPDLLSKLSKGVKCIVVSGTNGKTTSVRMIEEGFKRSGRSYFANLTGANLIEGITTDFIMNSSIWGKCRKEYAILETDEFASKEVCKFIQPEIIFVTNLFVDQVERFGGVKGTREGLYTGVKNAPNAVLVLNADDSVSSSLSEGVNNKVLYFGIDKSVMDSTEYSGSSDVNECILCGEKLTFDYMTFSHLGAFSCPKCGHKRHNTDYTLKEIIKSDLTHSELLINDGCKDVHLNINLPAMYNMYNALGAYAVMRQAGISENDAVMALSSFSCGFGRMEEFPQLGKYGSRMVLVKNGAGCDQVLEFLKKYNEEFILSIYLNNNVSDGVDITWLDSANFEALNDCKVCHIYVSGLRTEEMYERLLKAGISESKLEKEKDVSSLISKLKCADKPVFILPTYTGMMATRSEIVRQCGGKQYWEGK